MPATRDGEAERRGDGAVETLPTRTVALRYVGQGAALADVPARDLYDDEIAAYDRKALLASGLYEK